MDFALDDTQRAVAELTRDVLAREADPDATWKALGQAGLRSGLDVVDTAIVLAEIGRAAAPLPVLSLLASVPVVHCGTEAQRDDLLSGERLLTAALRGSVTATGNLLSGKAVGVAHAADAYRILVPAGDEVYLVLPADTALTATRSSSGTPEHTVVLDDTPGERLCDTVDLHRFAVACACAYGDGLVAGALDLTAAHVRTREQFGKPLATFQAVAQQIADVYVASRTLHLAAWSAISRLADGDLAVAAYWLTEEALPALHTCHHLHGGLGVDASYPLHRHYSATKDLVRLLGGVEHRLARLGAVV
jgi:alkylation response protein AidB-like acyl-CoA dehydrogenase